MSKDRFDLTQEEIDCLYFEDSRTDTMVMVTENALDYLDKRLEFFKIPVTIKENDGTEVRGIALALNANDLFYWACADYEILSYDDIENLFHMCFDSAGKWQSWGDSKWICLRRGMRPQNEIIKTMKKDGAWDAVLESLPVREVNFLNPDFEKNDTLGV